jgi:dipeptidase E
MRKLLLISNSTQSGQEYLDHCLPAIDEFLGKIRSVVFVPFALQDHEAYGEKVRKRLAEINVVVSSLTPDRLGERLARRAEAVFVGGGNTFRLLKTLRESGLLGILRGRALAGIPYIGSSAGTNIAAPTIRTTNDMPIVEPGSLDALGLIPFQINPHFIDTDPTSTHMGETREQRLLQFHEENEMPVLALREGAWVRIDGNGARLGGTTGARLFLRGRDPVEVAPDEELDDLLRVETPRLRSQRS